MAESAEDDASITSTGSSTSKSSERRKRREHWLREHENQLKVDGTFPRRHSSGDAVDHDKNARLVSAKVVQHLGTKTTAKLHTLPPAVSDSVRVRSNLLRTVGIQKEVVAVDDSSAGLLGGSGGRGRTGRQHRRIQSADGRSLLLGPSSNTNTAMTTGELSSMVAKPPPPNRPLLSNVRMNEELKYDSDDEVDTTTATTSNYHRFFGLNKPNNNNNNSNNNNSTQSQTNNLPTIPRRPRILFSNSVTIVPIPMRSEYSSRIKERMYSNRVELSENAQRNVVEFEAEGWDASGVLEDESQFYKCPLTGELIHPVHLSYFKNSGGGEGGSGGGGENER